MIVFLEILNMPYTRRFRRFDSSSRQGNIPCVPSIQLGLYLPISSSLPLSLCGRTPMIVNHGLESDPRSNVHYFSTSLSAVQIYDFHIFLTIYSSLHDQLPVGLVAQLVERCTGISEVMGSNPVQA